MAKHTLHFAGKGGAGVDPSHGPLLREILDIVVDGCQQATRLRLDGRSTAPGMVPAWLERAASFEIVKIRPGELVVKSPPLAKAAPDRFRQLELFSEVDPSRSGLDLFEDSLEDALAGREDSDRYDRPLMETLEGFGRLFRYGVERVEVHNGRRLRVDRAGIESIQALGRRTPEDRRVLIAGKLETIRHSDRAFSLLVESGEELRGIVISEAVTRADLAALFGHQALVTGYAKFRPSGALLRIEAERIEPASERDIAVFSAAPSPLLDALDARELRRPQGTKSGLAAIVGQWPGDETDDQVLAALADLS
jgi:hypothetical protein